MSSEATLLLPKKKIDDIFENLLVICTDVVFEKLWNWKIFRQKKSHYYKSFSRQTY